MGGCAGGGAVNKGGQENTHARLCFCFLFLKLYFLADWVPFERGWGGAGGAVRLPHRRLMLLLEEKIQKMEQKNLGEMVFAAERLTKKRLKAGRMSTWSNGKDGVQSTALGSQRRTSSTQGSSRCLRTMRWSSSQRSGDQNQNLSKRRKPRGKR